MSNPNENGPNPDLMGTEERRQLLNAYLDGELSAEDALHVRTWLDANPGALREVEHLRHIWDLLEHYEDEPVSEGFAPDVMASVGIRRGAKAGRMVSMAWYRRPIATAAAMLVAVGATVFVMSRGGEEGVGVPPIPNVDVAAVLEDVPADQLEQVLLNADVLLSVDDAALDEEFDEESLLGS